MDGSRFDDITKALTKPGTSRREVLKLLAGGAGGGLLALLGGEASAARCTTYRCRGTCCPAPPPNGVGACSGKQCTFGCDDGFKPCGSACIPATDCCFDGQPGCAGCQVCEGGECGDPRVIPLCGACFQRVCNAITDQYECESLCDAGQVCCAGSCAASCTNGCTRNPTTCSCDTPLSGQGYCVLSDTCVSNVCPAGQLFNQGACECQCPSGTTVCDGTCLDTQTDANNCGSCGNACTADEVCTSGQCTCANACLDGCCPAGYICWEVYDGVNPVCCKPGPTACTCPSGYCVSQGLCYPC